MKRTALLMLAVFLAPSFGAAAEAPASPAPPTKPVAGGEPWSAAQISKLRADIDELLQSPALRGAHAGFLAQDIATKTPLYARRADDDFMPASNLKLVTGSAALARLGPGFRFHTAILAGSALSADVLNGDVILRGGGDALLRATDVDAAAAALAALGLRHVRGNLLLDATYFDGPSYPRGWVWDDFPYYYAPLVSALALEDNTIHVRVTPGAVPGARADLSALPVTTAFVLINEVTTGARDAADTVDMERTADGNIRVFGVIPLGAQTETIDPAVPDPLAYAGDVFKRALSAHGISVSGTIARGAAPAGATVLWTHDSDPLPLLLRQFWYESDNLVGEMLLKSLGVARAGVPGRGDRGIELERDFLHGIGVDPATVVIADGSGLSIYNRVTPRSLVAVLLADWDAPYRDAVIDALPLAGVRGSLREAYLATPAQGRVFAKTGSMTHVSSLSGYIATRRHGTVVFSFMLDDALGEGAALTELRGRILSRFVTD